jgi:hypothetical protein
LEEKGAGFEVEFLEGAVVDCALRRTGHGGEVCRVDVVDGY